MNHLDNYIIVDIGANLTNKKFSRDLDSVIQRAKDSGVSKIMVTGTSLQSSRDALRLSRLYPGILYATAGKPNCVFPKKGYALFKKPVFLRIFLLNSYIIL